MRRQAVPNQFSSLLATAFLLVTLGSHSFLVWGELPPFVTVKEYGGVDRERFPVTGAIPLPKGTLKERELPNLRLLGGANKPLVAQFSVTGRWLDGSVKWLLLDFPSTQEAGSLARYSLRRSGNPSPPDRLLAQADEETILVDTGRLRARFGAGGLSILLRTDDGWNPAVSPGGLVSRIGVRERATKDAKVYTLPLRRPVLETNGPQRAVVKVEGWHAAADGDRFSPSVVRFTFYRAQAFVRLHHSFVVSKDPGTHLITDITLEVKPSFLLGSGIFQTDNGERKIDIGRKRVSVFQENLDRPRYSEEPRCEFEGRFRVFDGDRVVASGARYPGGFVLRGSGPGLAVYVKDFWQLSPKALSYDPALRTLKIGLYPGEFAGELDLQRTEIKNPPHYRAYRKREKEHWGKYSPTYVPHDLVHSAMGISRTHEVILWFVGTDSLPTPGELNRLFRQPFVPFVSGEWNVATGVLGKNDVPGAHGLEAEATSKRMIDEQREVIERQGWYGLLRYGNVRYTWDKKRNDWLRFHPKYSWYHAGHLMSGGTLTQVLWNHYLRYGDPRDYSLAEARGKQVMDLSVVHYHDRKEWIGAMLRHGGPDPWIGHRKVGGGHYPIAGLPIHYYVSGDERAADAVRLLGETNYPRRQFDLGRNQDTNLANMVLLYRFTADRKYYERAAEYVNHYYENREKAANDLTFFNYFATAIRWFHDVCDDPVMKEKAKSVFFARYQAHLDERRLPGNPEMAAFAYELAPSQDAARRLEESVESFVREGSGQIGWYDNMLLVSPNETALVNAVAYAGYWLERIRAGRTGRPRIAPDGASHSGPVDVRVSCETPEAAIRYTLDGTEPTARSTLLRGLIRVSENVTLRARAFRAGLEPSEVVETTFHVDRSDVPRAGLAAWFRSDRGLKTVDSRVVSWRDQSGNGRHALAGRLWPERARRSAEASLGPLRASAPRVATSVGLSVVLGDFGRYLRLRRYVPLTGDCTLVFVASSGRHGSGPLLGDGDDGLVETSADRIGVRFNVGVPGVAADLRKTFPPGSLSLLTVIRKGKEVRLFHDGSALKPARVPVVTPLNLEILLAMRVWTNFCRGGLCELLVYDRALTAAERERVEGALRKKYGPFPRALGEEIARLSSGFDPETGEEGEGEETGETPERPAPERPKAEAEGEKEASFTGVVKAVDARKRIVRIEQEVDDGERSVTKAFRIARKVMVIAPDGETIPLRALKVGVRVTVQIGEDGESAMRVVWRKAGEED